MTVDSVRPGVVLAVYAHPDDPAVSCGGALARWARAGAAVHLLICTRGDKGSADPDTDPEALAVQRAEETASSAEALGLAGHELLDYPDGEIANTADLREQLVTRIRRIRPDVVVSSDPTAVYFGDSYVNHPDHRTVGWALLDACVPAASSPLYFPEAGEAHHVESIYLSGTLQPDTWIDIGEVLDVKVDALRCHATQLPGQDDLVDEMVRHRAAEAGRETGVEFAEGYRRLRLA